MSFRSQDPTLERSFRGHKDIITGLCFKPSMSQLASSSMDHSVMIWNFKPQLRAFRFVGHKGPVTSLDFASSGNVLASSSRDNTVRLWTPNVKGDVTVFKAHTSTVRMVQFSNDDENLVTCSDDKSIKLWSTHRTKFQYSLTGHLNWVRSAKFSPDARLILSGSDDKTVKLWDLNSKSCIKTYWDHTGVVTSVAFHPSGTTIATTSIDKSIKLFDIRTHKLIQHYGDAHGAPSTGSQTLDGSQSFAGGVNSVAFGGHNGEWLISTGMDGLIKVWDVKEGHLFYTLHGHKGGPTTSAVFSPNGDFFATGGSDSQVMVWKSNFDQIDKLDIEYDPIRQPTPHATQPFPHNQHMTHTELPGSNKLRPKTASPTFSSKVQTAKPALVSHKPSARIYDDREPIQLSAPIISDVNNMDADKSSTPFDFAGMNINTPKAATSPLQVQHIPDQVASTLSHIVRQIDILTQTMSILENRLTLNEDRLIDLTSKFDQVLEMQPKSQPGKLPTSRSYTTTPDRTQNISPAFRTNQSSPEQIRIQPKQVDLVSQSNSPVNATYLDKSNYDYEPDAREIYAS